MVDAATIERIVSDEPLSRKLQKKDADPALIMDALDVLADVNYHALDETAGLIGMIQQTLATGSQYPQIGNDIPARYNRVVESMKLLIGVVDNLHHHRFPGSRADVYKAAFARVLEEVKPSLQQLDQLFRNGYHIPSPIDQAVLLQGYSVIENIGDFNGLFAKPVVKASRILSGGSKPGVKIETVETVEDVVRLLHDDGLERIKQILHYTIEGMEYQHLKRIDIQRPDYFTKDTHPLIRGLGQSEAEIFRASPMWPITDAMSEYMLVNNHYRPEASPVMGDVNIILTERSLSAIMRIVASTATYDKTNCSLHVFYDERTQRYTTKFFCGSKSNFTDDFLEGVRRSMKQGGFTMIGEGMTMTFWLEKRSDAHYIKTDVRYLFDTFKAQLIGY